MVTTNILIFLLLIIVLYYYNTQLVEGTSDRRHNFCNNDSNCPTWFICDNHNKCQCGNNHGGAVSCANLTSESAVLENYCITYNKKTGFTHLGACFYSIGWLKTINNHSAYVELPMNSKMLLNESACTYFHRTGLLCGDCEDGHSPLVLSYNLSCVKCPDGHKNWWKFILVAFVPLTFFYFFILLFNISVTSSHLRGVVLYNQAVSMPVLVRQVFSVFRKSHKLITLTKFYVFFCGFWNLNLLHSLTPDICLNLTTLQALVLDYLLAFYPFLLILISYIFIHLYDRKIACIVILWKPFHKFLTFFKKSWDVRTSVIDSFSTFFLLSYVKILSVTEDVLVPTEIYQLGSNTSTFGLYYSPSVTYFGPEHRPYAIMAIVILTLFVIIPTIMLTLYPFRFFQKCISIFPINWHFLHAFVDSFQGCYKDGTEPGTFDCRWFSVLIILIRPALFIIEGLTLSQMFFVYATITFAIFLIAEINIHPFKKVAARYSSIDIIFLVSISLCYVAVLGRSIAITRNHGYSKIMPTFAFLSVFASIAYTISLIAFWLVSRMNWTKSLLKACRE